MIEVAQTTDSAEIEAWISRPFMVRMVPGVKNIPPGVRYQEIGTVLRVTSFGTLCGFFLLLGHGPARELHTSLATFGSLTMQAGMAMKEWCSKNGISRLVTKYPSRHKTLLGLAGMLGFIIINVSDGWVESEMEIP